MPAWTTISNALVAVGAKPFATTMQALRDNPQAIAEGAANAPKVMGQALGNFLDHKTPAANNFDGWTGLDRATWVEVFGHHDAISAGAGLQARLSEDNGGSWNATGTVSGANLNSGVTGFFRLIVNMETGAFRCVSTSGAGAVTSYGSGTLSRTAAANGLQIRSSSISGIVRFDGKVLGGIVP